MTTLADRNFDRLIEGAISEHQAGRLDKAQTAYLAALEISPGHPGVTHNLGVIAAAQGEPLSAIGFFDRAIAAQPYYAPAYFNRAIAHQTLGRTRQAIEGFSRVSALEPGHYDAHRALGFLWLAEGERGRSLDHFARTYELRRGEDQTGNATKSMTWATRDKLLHDAEQFRFLASRRRDGQGLEALARTYDSVAKEFSGEAEKISSRLMDLLGEDYNTAINISEAAELPGRAVSERTDRAAITKQFNESGAVYFDELLTPQALRNLKQYLLESTIWHDFSHMGGFVASYLEDGLACPLFLQIGDEIRQTFPEVEKRPLSQAWAFKGLKSAAAVEAHADDAAISVNFWLTPDEANLDRDHGGLIVCRKPPPPEWQMTGYKSDSLQIAEFMEKHAGDSLVVHYRENRAALFRSRLFHRSDAPRFAGGYENYRINVTMLFGVHEN